MLATAAAMDMAKAQWPNARLDTLENFAEPSLKRSKVDVLISIDDILKVPNAAVPSVYEKWSRLLRSGGQLHLFVNSLEWAAEQILAEDPSPLLFDHLYGSQTNNDEYFVSGHTMRRLRADLDRAGYHVIRARAGEYEAVVDEQTVIVGEKHYIVAVWPG